MAAWLNFFIKKKRRQKNFVGYLIHRNYSYFHESSDRSQSKIRLKKFFDQIKLVTFVYIYSGTELRPPPPTEKKKNTSMYINKKNFNSDS